MPEEEYPRAFFWRELRAVFAQDVGVRAARELRAIAHKKAVALLTSLLTPAQAAEYGLNGAFNAVGAHDCTYRFGSQRGPDRKIPGGGTEQLCVHVSVQDWRIPAADHIVAQLLQFLADERAFLKTSRAYRPDRGIACDPWWPGEEQQIQPSPYVAYEAAERIAERIDVTTLGDPYPRFYIDR